MKMTAFGDIGLGDRIGVCKMPGDSSVVCQFLNRHRFFIGRRDALHNLSTDILRQEKASSIKDSMNSPSRRE
jgi:hypothetical protein